MSLPFNRTSAPAAFNLLAPAPCPSAALPFYSFHVPAGFPSPAQDHMEQPLSIDELLNLRAPHTYLVRFQGDSMVGAGIHDGDLGVIDRSKEALHGDIVIAAVNNEPLVKRLSVRGKSVVLMSENPHYPPRYILEGDELSIWGVVRYSVLSALSTST